MKSHIFLAASLLSIGLSATTTISTVKADAYQGLIAKNHLTTKDGWSNDLQSIVWNSKYQYYDVYFLHSISANNIFGEEGQNWYHTTTKDFKTYTEQSEAIPSHGGDSTQGWKSAWTGSIIENKNGLIKGAPKGAMVAYFSGLRKSDGKQNIWAAYSSDGGKTFTNPLNNGKPIADVNNAINKNDFRDPYIFTYKNSYIMYVAEGNEIGAYKSNDGISWKKADTNGASKIGNGTFFKGRSWDGNAPIECPVIKTMTDSSGNKKQVLLFGAKDASKGETTGTYYIVGHLDTNGLFAPESNVQRLDQGSDFYGANFTGSTDISESTSEITALGWIGNWNYTANGIHSDEQANSSYIERLGSYSSARIIKLGNDGKLNQSVILQNAKYTKTYTATKNNTVNSNNGMARKKNVMVF